MSGMFGELGGLFGGGGAPAQEGVGNLLSDALGKAGGVQGLLDRANQAGLGEHVRSWIGDGSNWPVSPSEITRIFPPEELDQFAQAHGLPAGAASEIMAQFLPHAVDQATTTCDPETADRSAASGGGFDFGGLAKRLLG